VHKPRPKRHKKAAPVAVKPKPAPKPKVDVKPVSSVRVGGVAAAVATNESDAARRTAVIAGLGIAALLFLIVVTVPATAVRFTAAGRSVMDHQTDLVLTGVATLLLTSLLFLVTK